MMPLTEPTKTNTVYKYYDRVGRLIYIGSTVRGGKRQDEHATSSPWFRQHVVTQDLETCRDREEMLRVERELIKLYRPPFNKVHNENWENVRAAYLAVVAAEEAYAKVQAGGMMPTACLPNCTDAKTCLYGPDAERDYCGRPDCHVCHSRFHGCQDGYNVGYEEGLACGTRRAARAASRSNPQRCGHCTGCREKDDPWATPEDSYCEALNSGDCETCGRPDCLFVSGKSEGSVEGYMQGCEWGRKHGYGLARTEMWPAFSAADQLYWHSSREHQAGTLIIPEGFRDRALNVLIEANRKGLLGELAAEAVAAKEPF